MRIWSLHPKYLDAKGIVALWRETLLAQKSLQGKTKGYKNHPQLQRFKNHKYTLQAIANYLHLICDEAENRNYNFQRNKIVLSFKDIEKIPLNDKQLEYEWKHFLNKIKIRDNNRYQLLKNTKKILFNPLFELKQGEIESWEIISK